MFKHKVEHLKLCLKYKENYSGIVQYIIINGQGVLSPSSPPQAVSSAHESKLLKKNKKTPGVVHINQPGWIFLLLIVVGHNSQHVFVQWPNSYLKTQKQINKISGMYHQEETKWLGSFPCLMHAVVPTENIKSNALYLWAEVRWFYFKQQMEWQEPRRTCSLKGSYRMHVRHTLKSCHPYSIKTSHFPC